MVIIVGMTLVLFFLTAGGVVEAGSPKKKEEPKKKTAPEPLPPLPKSTDGPCGSDVTIRHEGGFHECCMSPHDKKKVMGVGGAVDLSRPQSRDILAKYAPNLKFEEVSKTCGQAKHCLTKRQAKHIFLAETYRAAKTCVQSLLHDWSNHPLSPPPPSSKKKTKKRRHHRHSHHHTRHHKRRPRPAPKPSLKIPRAVRNAMIDIAFTMMSRGGGGAGCEEGFQSFGEMLHYIRRGQWKEASRELGSTQWCAQRLERCQIDQKCIASGK